MKNKEFRKAEKLQQNWKHMNQFFFEEESLTLHSAMFDKSTKKLVLEKVHSKIKKFKENLVQNLTSMGFHLPRIVRIHEATRESLKMSVDEMENENSTLKDRIKELESALMPPPIFSSPIATMQPWKSFDGTPESSSILRGTSSLLVVVRRYVGENIKKIMSLILEA
jgi:hypothetical protein